MTIARQDNLAYRLLYSVEQSMVNYPIKSPRYFRYGMHYAFQDCYTPEEIELTATLAREFAIAFPNDKQVDYFTLNTALHWRGWIECVKPSFHGPLEKTLLDAFTLPNREERNTQLFPLWELGNKLAIKIANLQSERFNGQDPQLMNDPTMRTLEELKDWAFYRLSLVECQPSVKDIIEARRSYVKLLGRLIPSFGLDEYHFHKLQDDLEEAQTVLTHCIANKNLPGLLSDAITSIRELEKLIVGCLNLLHVNEKVDSNYSPFNLGEQPEVIHSPVERLFRHARQMVGSTLQAAGIFFEVKNKSNVSQVLVAKEYLLETVKFNSAMTEQDKTNYFSLLASLDFLTKVRKNLESLKPSQTDFGTYLSAYELFKEVDPLTQNHGELIDKIKVHLHDLIRSAEIQKGDLLKRPSRVTDSLFLENYHTLERNFARGTTLDTRLNQLSAESLQKMQEYKTRMMSLVADLRNQKAKKEFDRQLASLREDFHHLNRYLRAFVQGDEVDLKSMDALENTDELCLLPDQSIAQQIYDVEWDKSATWVDGSTGEKIHFLRFYQDGREVGALEVKRHPLLCRLPETQQLNVHKAYGALTEMDLYAVFPVDKECPAAPLSWQKQALDSALQAGVVGGARGLNNVIAAKCKERDIRTKWLQVVYPVVQYGTVFTFKYHCYQKTLKDVPESVRTVQALQLAAVDTVKLGVIDLGISILNWFSNQAEKRAHPKLAQGLKSVGSMVRYGLFAYGTVSQGVMPTVAGVAAGVAAEQGVVQFGKLI